MHQAKSWAFGFAVRRSPFGVWGSEAAASEFRVDAQVYVGSKAQRVIFPKLKPSTTSISIRLPDNLLAHIKHAANKRDIPYQSLIKVWLSEKVASVFETRGVDPKQQRGITEKPGN